MGPHVATFTSMVFLYEKYKHASDEGALFLDTANPDLMFPHRIFSRTFVTPSMPEVIPKVGRPIQKITDDHDQDDDDPWYQDPNHAILIRPPDAEVAEDSSQNPPSDIDMRDEENQELDREERLNLSMHSINDEGVIDLDDAVEFACQDSPQRKAFSSSEEESDDSSDEFINDEDIEESPLDSSTIETSCTSLLTTINSFFLLFSDFFGNSFL